MKNPLRKRLPRELKDEIGKYLVIFLLLTVTIGFVSGFLVADGSMITAYHESFTKYNIEDGHFHVSKQLNKAQTKSIQGFGVTLYEDFYVEEPLTNGSTMRIFANRTQVNRACVMEGELPDALGEIAIDRMYADNNGVSVGDTLSDGTHSWTVTGFVALSDYSALFSNNSDTMFDAVKFGVSVVTAEEFSALEEDGLVYSYAWRYDEAPADEVEENDVATDLLTDMAAEVSLEEFVPRYQNQAIQFTGEDMGSDRAMMIMLLYIVIVIMAFVFGITISDTISREANVIGTLRASGYTRMELVRHYMTLPTLVTLIGALVGNLLGYTVMKDVCVGMYYGSYSLPTYVTIWNGEAFMLTTVVPVVMMMLINFLILTRKLSLSPLKFLRRDLSRKKQRRAFPLSAVLPFFSRFRLRVVFQNASNYAVLLVGIMFANLLLMFGLGLPACLDYYQADMESNLLSNYQYILQVPFSAMNEEHKLESLLSMMQFQNDVETDNPDAEKFTAYTLKTLGEGAKIEDVMIYGVVEDSQYIPIEASGNVVCISQAYADKFLLTGGDTITLKEPYEDTRYTFTVGGVYNYGGALAVFMEQDSMNDIFDLGKGYFSGYFSNSEITDIDSGYIGSVIDLEALTKVSRQLDVSMGDMMYLVDGFAIVIFMVLIYLLTKIIIEKNAQSISLAKILGYTNGEISRLYIVSTSIVVILFLIISIPVMYRALVVIFRLIMMQEMAGWIPLKVGTDVFVKMLVIGIVTYAAVSVLEYKKIRKVPMDEALKNVE